jgi:SagB-type dehydrogenase family enzyme
MNDLIATAKGYHRATEYDRHAMEGHYLDWPNQPEVYKKYPGVPSLKLPKKVNGRQEDLHQLSIRETSKKPGTLPDCPLLADIFRRAYRLTARTNNAGQNFYYRNVASAGALYPTELYLSASAMVDLDPGLYHYGIATGDLSPIRKGNIHDIVKEATDGHGPEGGEITFIITGIIFRSAWKYRSRAYRYVLLDGGHLLENLILALKSLSLPFSFGVNFDDKRLNQIIGIDGRKEVCLGYVHLLNRTEKKTGICKDDVDFTKSVPEAQPISGREQFYEKIEQIHDAGAGVTQFDHGNIRAGNDIGINAQDGSGIKKYDTQYSQMGYPEIVNHRRSSRNFTGTVMPGRAFDNLLGLVCNSFDRLETVEKASAATIRIGLLTGNVEGVQTGFYLLDPEKQKIGIVREGDMTTQMSKVCLNQEWLANAAVHFLLITNLDYLDRLHGPRGYRHAMITAGRLGQMIYLGATANQLGCCGIGALYDGEARELLGLNAQSALLYLVAAGPVKRLP